MWMRCWPRSLALGVTYVTLAAAATMAQDQVRVVSPDGRNRVTVEIRDGALHYGVQRDGRAALLASRLPVQFRRPA